MQHVTVLKEETIASLKIKADGIYVDGTLGYAGASQEILSRVKRGFLFAFDQDEHACLESEKTLRGIGDNFEIIKSNFCHLKSELAKRGVHAVDGIIFDLGISSVQIDNPKRGFSFMQDGPLDMRMDLNAQQTASDIVNTYSEAELTKLFFTYGEEKRSKAIARGIVNAQKPIKTTKALAKIIESSVGAKYFHQHHPERQIFQALRIEVNQELKVLADVLPAAIDLLKPTGRICIISFHSLEDRIIKQTFKTFSEINPIVKGSPDIPLEYQPKIKIINKKPILPSEVEIKQNPRSRSAKLRVIERI